MQTKPTHSDSLTGLVLKRALDTASKQTGLKLQPLVNDKQEADVEPIVVASLLVDRDKHCLKLQLIGTNEDLNTWTHWGLFRLLIKHRNLLHESDSLAVLHTELSQDGHLTLTLEMPKQLNKVFNREFFRVSLDQRIKLPVTLHLGRFLNITGTLEDFSAGGCRVALSPQLALHFIRPIEYSLSCTITFPNGYQLNTPFEMTYLKPQEGFLYALVGCHFQHNSLQDEKEFMRYAFEIEREISRLSNIESVVKYPSPLFETTDKKAHKNVIKEKHLAASAITLVPKGYAEKIQMLADQLALQALLLAMHQTLNASKLKPLAIDFIDALETNGNAVRLALQQPHPLINPVILHTLRVISYCFPLVFKIGINRGMELPVMMSLLLHDLGKLFVSEQPCFNPLKLTPDRLRLMKQHQIQLLRAASALNWIPPNIGESLMVNANERLDGSGYPRGLQQGKLDALSRLVAVCKVLDCLVHGYNDPAMRWRDAYKWVYKHKHWFDLPMLRGFIQYYGLQPLAS
ncbi:MAG TPA: HD domain-containing phosphohydrolase [Marinospirillum sp.]|uniref:HD domain-containing phosphohydrolase n=1 Tax=Marinospirillum sp. TaxID=2183934 RepID=UPI002B4A5CBF|nr:HD domain-containing phosphohydrolase [Marinospirillum sp.]HKM14294.1 HD domain-containing phosphohydrolase [Marinospirillum sp.]